jgi:hypothetical protein
MSIYHNPYAIEQKFPLCGPEATNKLNGIPHAVIVDCWVLVFCGVNILIFFLNSLSKTNLKLLEQQAEKSINGSRMFSENLN